MKELQKRWEFVDGDTLCVEGRKLTRIRAIIHDPLFRFRAGDLGGYVEMEDNLPQGENGWVGSEARVYGDARVLGNARISGDARVFGKARIFDDALVCGDARVCDNAWVFGNARVGGRALVFSNARVGGDKEIGGVEWAAA